MENFPAWLIPLAVNVGVAAATLKVLLNQFDAVKRELHDLSRELRTTRENIAALQKADGYHQASIEKLEERVQRLAEYWRRGVGQ